MVGEERVVEFIVKLGGWLGGIGLLAGALLFWPNCVRSGDSALLTDTYSCNSILGGHFSVFVPIASSPVIKQAERALAGAILVGVIGVAVALFCHYVLGIGKEKLGMEG